MLWLRIGFQGHRPWCCQGLKAQSVKMPLLKRQGDFSQTDLVRAFLMYVCCRMHSEQQESLSASNCD